MEKIMDKNEILSILHKYKNDFAEKYGIISLGVFGSVALGKNHQDSDVDICIKTVTPDPFILVHIKSDIEERVQQHVDIIRLREKMNPLLKERINRDAIYV